MSKSPDSLGTEDVFFGAVVIVTPEEEERVTAEVDFRCPDSSESDVMRGGDEGFAPDVVLTVEEDCVGFTPEPDFGCTDLCGRGCVYGGCAHLLLRST